MFNDKYVRGVVVSVAQGEDFGFLEMTNNHEEGSYLTLYKDTLNKFSRVNLYDTLFFKVKYTDYEIPIAHKITTAKMDDLYKRKPFTHIPWHGFYNHGSKNQPIHSEIHLMTGRNLKTQGEEFNSWEFSIGRNSEPIILKGDDSVLNFIESLTSFPKLLWVEFDNETKEITDIDTCHRHGNGPCIN